MTREEAINILNALKFILNNDQYTDEIEEALDMAISALQQPNQFADGDKKDDHLREVTKKVSVISRQAAIDALDVLCQEHRYRIPGKRETYSQYNEAWQDALDRAENAIGNLPSAQPEIIRCKDCKYYHPYYCEVWSKFGIIQTRENGYCYMAERREE